MNSFGKLFVIVLCAGLFGCLEDLTDSTDNTSSGTTSGSGTSGGSYDWSYTCPGGYGGGGTVPIPVGSCESEYKNYAQVFGCNDVNNFNSAACDLENCTGIQSGCGYY
jgi:hypothetical protein